MDLFALTLVLLTGTLITPAHSLLPRDAALVNRSPDIAAAPTSTQVADSPQITPEVPQSEVLTGRYTLTPVPSQCTDSFIPYQTTFWAQQNQMNMEDAVNPSWWGPDPPVDWTFSTDTAGVFFSEPAWIAAGNNPALNLKPRDAGNSFTLTMDKTDGGQTLLWLIYQDNGTTPDIKAWNSTLRDAPHTPNYEQVMYELTISGQLPCAHPVGDKTCSSNKIELTPEAWSSYGVDDFMKDWYNNRSSAFATAGGMMQVFGKDFGIGENHICTIDNACNLINSCSDLPNHGTDPNSAQIYLAWQALQNISDMFNRMYNNMNIAQGDTMTKIAQIALEFYTPIQAAAAPPNPLATTPGILGLLSTFVGLIPGGKTVSTALSATGAIIGIVNAKKADDHAPIPPDPQFAKSDGDLGVVFGNYTNGMRTQLQNIHTSIFTGGNGLLDLLRGGTFIDRSALNVDCDGCIPKAQAWLEQMMTLKMINYMWLRQNVFVTYMPYGKIIQLDSLEQTDFTIDSCYSNFLKDGEKHIVACMPGGMARLTYYNPANASWTEPDPDGKVNLSGMPPGADKDTSYNSTAAVSVNFSPTSAAISSVAGFLVGGQNYDAITSLSNSVLSGDYEENLQQLYQINATSAGMFTLPVCQIRDLNYWPTFYGQGNDRRSYNDYCVCYNDLNSDPVRGAFTDHVAGDLQKFVTKWRDGIMCDKGHGTEPGVAGSPVGLAPRGMRNLNYVPLPWP